MDGEAARLQSALEDVGRVASLDHQARVDLLIQICHLESLVSAMKARTLSAFAGGAGPRARIAEDLAAEVLKLPPRAMAGRLADARTLVTLLPSTLSALERGQISAAHAKYVVDGVYRLPGVGPDGLRQYETALLSKASGQTPRQLSRAVARQVLLADPEGAQRRSVVAKRGRRVEVENLEDGMATLHWNAPASDVHTVFRRVDAAARALPSRDGRSRDQQRSDLVGDALLAAFSTADLPTKQGRGVHASIHVNLSTMLGLDDAYGYLDGYGPIAKADVLALVMAEDTAWRRLVEDDRGRPVDLSKQYRPSQRLRDLILASHETCVAPGCGQPAVFAELDHTTPYDRGGPTSRENLCPLCKRHHQGKTHAGYRYTHNPDDSHTWTFGTAHTFTRAPERRLEPHPSFSRARTSLCTQHANAGTSGNTGEQGSTERATAVGGRALRRQDGAGAHDDGDVRERADGELASCVDGVMANGGEGSDAASRTVIGDPASPSAPTS